MSLAQIDSCIASENEEAKRRREEAEEIGRAVISAIASISFVSLDDFEIIQPWDSPQLQKNLDIARLADAIQMMLGEANVQANLKLLSCIPPGSDRVGLRLLSHLLGHSATDVVRSGIQAMQAKALEFGHIAQIPDDWRSCQTPVNVYDELRVQALAGLCASMGYELEDGKSGEIRGGTETNFVGQRAILDGGGSVFPLGATWMFLGAGQRNWASTSRYRGILAWTLGLLETCKADTFLDTSWAELHAALFDMLFFEESDTGKGDAIHDPVIQLLGSALFTRFMKKILDQGRFLEAWTLPKVRAAAEALTVDSFGDCFFGCALATLFCDRIVTYEWQEELIALLKDGMALQYLPKLDESFLSGECIRARLDSTGMDFQFLLAVISTQSFEKALQTQSLAVDVVMQALMAKATDGKRLELVTTRLAKYPQNELAMMYIK